MMDGKEGPVKVLEEKAHTERVDSILWSNLPEIRFAFRLSSKLKHIYNIYAFNLCMLLKRKLILHSMVKST